MVFLKKIPIHYLHVSGHEPIRQGYQMESNEMGLACYILWVNRGERLKNGSMRGVENGIFKSEYLFKLRNLREL